MKITVAPLSVPSCLTIEAWNKIEHANKLFLQTGKHPYSKLLECFDFSTMDDLYETAEDFDELDSLIAERLISFGSDCVYATTGEVTAFNEKLKTIALEQGIETEILAGVSLPVVLFPEKSQCAAYTAYGLPETLDPSLGVVITEIDHSLIASEVKLALSEFYPDEWEIELARINEKFEVEKIIVPLCELDRRKDLDATTGIFVPPCEFEKLERFGLKELEHVMKMLRAPDGCPWDKEQTHASIKMDLIEESYEVIDAIDKQDDDAFVEELGDVLMQVVFHAEIAGEQCRFNMRDITTGIVSKLIYRHPHVFSDTVVSGSEDVLKNWDELKQKEKKQATVTDTLKAVPESFPALMRARKIQKRAAKVGFDWKNAEDAFPKIFEETDELRSAMSEKTNIYEELGDLLFSVVNVARLLKLDPEQALRDASDKFVRRFEKMEKLALSQGLELNRMTLEEMDLLWNEAKKL